MKDSKKDKPPASVDKRSGEVRHDARGHAVWHWAADTARNAVNSASQVLRRLDLSHLSLEENDQPSVKSPTPPKTPASDSRSAPAAKPTQAAPARARDAPAAGGGFNPYDVARSTSKRASNAVKPAAVKRPPPKPSARRSWWWQRLFRRD